MRELQKNCYGKKLLPPLLVAKKNEAEAVVDNALEDHEKRLARTGQLELFGQE
jgi:hypothetical protein